MFSIVTFLHLYIHVRIRYICKCTCNFRIFLFSLFQDAEKFGSLLTQTEDWLYDEGDDQLKQVYIDKLKELKVRIRYVSLYSVLRIGT